MTTDCVARIKRQIASNNVLLYLKGTPQFPMCGFSGRVVQILDSLNAKYAYVNILDNPEIRSTLPSVANWPTFPQLYVEGELIGGCDIVTEMNQKGELKPLLEQANAVGTSMAEVVLAVE